MRKLEPRKEEFIIETVIRAAGFSRSFLWRSSFFLVERGRRLLAGVVGQPVRPAVVSNEEMFGTWR